MKPNPRSRPRGLAIRLLRHAFEKCPWRKMPARERGRLLYKLANLIDQYKDELTRIESLDNGKPLKVSPNADLPMVVDCDRYDAIWAESNAQKVHTTRFIAPRPDLKYHAPREVQTPVRNRCNSASARTSIGR